MSVQFMHVSLYQCTGLFEPERSWRGRGTGSFVGTDFLVQFCSELSVCLSCPLQTASVVRKSRIHWQRNPENWTACVSEQSNCTLTSCITRVLIEKRHKCTAGFWRANFADEKDIEMLDTVLKMLSYVSLRFVQASHYV